jgi:hypothetical protein
MQRNHSLRQLSVLENRSNPALNLAPFGRWTLRDKAAQRRLALLQGLPPHFQKENHPG